MNNEIVIRNDIAEYMSELKEWLDESVNVPLEEMSDFFSARIDGYEEHMSLWKPAYERMATLVDQNTASLLDLGCGTGLELDEILTKNPSINVTGIDMSPDMLAMLHKKRPSVNTVCADYFKYDFGRSHFDTIITFESLHHFKPKAKHALFEKIYNALKCGGTYIEVDYLACCDEEETLLFETLAKKRAAQNIPDDVFVHFDTPLTVQNELTLLHDALFSDATLIDCIEGASIIVAHKI